MFGYWGFDPLGDPIHAGVGLIPPRHPFPRTTNSSLHQDWQRNHPVHPGLVLFTTTALAYAIFREYALYLNHNYLMIPSAVKKSSQWSVQDRLEQCAGGTDIGLQQTLPGGEKGTNPNWIKRLSKTCRLFFGLACSLIFFSAIRLGSVELAATTNESCIWVQIAS